VREGGGGKLNKQLPSFRPGVEHLRRTKISSSPTKLYYLTNLEQA
jgi:hypothetical protein